MLYMRTAFLLLSASFVGASHDTWSCTDDRYFPQTCLIAGPGGRGPHMAGVVTLGGAHSNASLDDVGVPHLACLVTRGTYGMIPQPLIAASRFEFCQDISLSWDLTSNFRWPSFDGDHTILFANSSLNLADMTVLASECHRLGMLSVYYATDANRHGVVQTNSTPWTYRELPHQAVTPTCPRLGGFDDSLDEGTAVPSGRGGTAAGFATFLSNMRAANYSMFTRGDLRSSENRLYFAERDIRSNYNEISNIGDKANVSIGVSLVGLAVGALACVMSYVAGKKSTAHAGPTMTSIEKA